MISFELLCYRLIFKDVRFFVIQIDPRSKLNVKYCIYPSILYIVKNFIYIQ